MRFSNQATIALFLSCTGASTATKYEPNTPLLSNAIAAVIDGPRTGKRRHTYGITRQSAGDGYRQLLMSADDARDLQATSTNTALQVCEAAIPMEEQVGIEYGTSCQCTPNPIQRTAVLECTDEQCAYCNLDQTVCSGYTYGVVFDAAGLDVSYFEEDEYTHGRQGAVRYTETDGECAVEVGNMPCNACQMQVCDDGYYGIDVRCDNVEAGARYNSCQDGVTTTGILEAFNEAEFGECFTNFDICERNLGNMDPDRFDCFCGTGPVSWDGNILKCVDKCEYCNDDLTVCGQETYDQIFTQAQFSSSVRTISYTAGRADVVKYEELNCDAMGICRDCKALVDGVECASCDIRLCDDQTTTAPMMNCANVDASLTDKVDFCYTTPSLEGTVLQYFADGFTDKCTSKMELACKEAKVMYEAHEHAFDCECGRQEDDGSLELQCEATCGDLCNDESSVCVRESIYQDFVDDGISNYFRKDIQYTIGRKEMLSYVEYTDGICSMTIDGVGCKSCLIRTCADNPNQERAPLIDCSEFEGGAVLDLCQPDLRIETGIFERFSIEEFQECLDKTPANGVCQTAHHVTELPFVTNSTTLLISFDNTVSCGRESFAPGLWYTVMGTGAGLQASLCDANADFMAHVSVYEGSCNALACYDASEMDCKATWFGHAGVKYYVRVHGVGVQTGNFGMKLHEVNFAEEHCANMKVEMEQNPDLTTACLCEPPTESGTVRLHCKVDCTICQANGEVCVQYSDVHRFDKLGETTQIKEHYQFTMGHSEVLRVKRDDCIGADYCQSCEVLIGDSLCESCAFTTCEGSDEEQGGILATCGELVVNTCELDPMATFPITDNSTMFIALVDPSYDTCFSRDASEVCLDHRDYEQVQGEEDGVVCECQEVRLTGDHRLVCERRDCLQCNREHTACGYTAFGAIFGSEFGRVTRRFEGFQYIEGRSDLVAYHSYNDMTTEDTCMVTVNDETCQSCQKTTCEEATDGQVGPFHGMAMDCQNVTGGLFYDGCSPIALPGIFEFVNSESYQDCVAVESPAEKCEASLEKSMAEDSALKNMCRCEETTNGAYELICNDADDCQYCADKSGALCAVYSEFRAEINRFGSTVATTDSFQYHGGRDELFVIKDNQVECEVSINGELCFGCSFMKCEDPSHDDGTNYVIDCSNLLGKNATYQCGEGHEIFAAISHSAQYICESDTNAPTLIPSATPSSVLSDTVSSAPPASDALTKTNFANHLKESSAPVAYPFPLLLLSVIVLSVATFLSN